MGSWYAIHLRAGPYSWTIYPDDPGELGGILDGLRITTNWEEGNPVQGIPQPWTATFGIIVGHIRDVKDLNVGSNVYIRVDRDGPAGEQIAGYPPGWAPQYVPLALFVGRVSDLAAAPGPRPGSMVVRVTCTDHLVDLAGRTIGGTAYPEELVADRATRILREAGYPVPSDYLYGTLAARDAQPTDALQLLQETLAAEADPTAQRWIAANLTAGFEYVPTADPVPVTVNAATNTIQLPAGHGLTLEPGARLLFSSAVPTDWNLLENGHFAWGYPEGTSGWSRSNMIISQGKYGDGQPAVPVAGTYRMDCVSAGAAVGGANIRHTVTGLTPGDTYTLSAFLWVPSGFAAASWAVTMVGVANGNPATLTNQWQESKVTFTATADTHTVGIVNLAAFSGEAWVSVSGVQVVPGSTPKPWPFPAPLMDAGWEVTAAVKSVTPGAGGTATVLLAQAPLSWEPDPASWPTLDLQTAGSQVLVTVDQGQRVTWPEQLNPDYPFAFGWSAKRVGYGNAERPVNLPGVLALGPDGWTVQLDPRPDLDSIIPAGMAHLDTEWTKDRGTRIDRVVVTGANEQLIWGELPNAVPIEYRLDTQLTTEGDIANRVRFLLPEQTEDGWQLGTVQVLELPSQSGPSNALQPHPYLLPPIMYGAGAGGFVIFTEPRSATTISDLVEGQNPNGGTFYSGVPANAELTFDGGEWSIALELRPDVPRAYLPDWETLGVGPPYLSASTVPATITYADLDPAMTFYDLRLARRPD